MSAIVGIRYLDGRLVDQTVLTQMLMTLAHRGTDASGVWSRDSVGFGHGMLWTTPESLREQLPLKSRTGDFFITADARLDNRTDLIAELNFSGCSATEVSDSQLILAAYEKWGERCPEKLLGDFAFTIWDQRERKLFCTRDHFGVKPFYYYFHPSRQFVFASEIKALLCLPDVPRHLNERRIADHLTARWEDHTQTFYQHIFRLPPAHSMTVHGDAMQVRSYWTLDVTREVCLPSDDAYAEAFRELFTEAVRCRLRSAFPIGSHLSGGLDSSAVTCVARTLQAREGPAPFHTFSNIFDDLPQCDERPYIDAVLAQGGCTPHYVHADQVGPLSDIERVFWLHDEPLAAPNHFLPWELNRSAQQAGVRIVLDGFDGDTTVSHGATYFAELAQAGRWQIFAREANAVAGRVGSPASALLEYYGLSYLEELGRQWQWRTFAVTAKQIGTYFPITPCTLFLRHGVRPLLASRLKQSGLLPRRSRENTTPSILNPEFARHVGWKDTNQGDRSWPHVPHTVREEQWQKLTSGLFTIALELSDRCAAAFALEVRHPFMDKRLIEFCLALPPEQKLHDGWGRMVMRRALREVLPEKIRWRGGKTDMTSNFVHGLFTHDREVLDEVMLSRSAAIEQYVEMRAVRRIHQRLQPGNKMRVEDVMVLWKVLTLALWFSYKEKQGDSYQPESLPLTHGGLL